MQRQQSFETSTPTNPSRAIRHSASNLILQSLAVSLIFGIAALLPAHAEHVHQLYYNNSQWVDQDLTALTGGGIASPFGGIAAFATTPNNQLHVYYVDSNANHVHQIYFDNTNWHDDDLTAFTGGPNGSVFGISGFAIGNLQYVFYVAADGHVHELNYNNVNWTDYDITTVVGGNLAGGYNIVAFTTKPNNQFHVYYQDSISLEEYQLYFNGTSWSYQNLTAIAGAYCYTDWTGGLATGNLQHILCPGYGNSGYLDLIHLYYNNFTWVYEDVTEKVHGAQLALGAPVAGFQVPGTGQGELYSVTDDTHVHQYTYKNGKWSDLDLSSTIGAPDDAYYGGMTAFATTPNKQFHIYYQPSSEVFQLYFNGTSWVVNDLTGGVGQASYYGGGMAGFAIGNLQHVFYLAVGN